MGLYDHPGGARDSDAWVDAFRLSVTFEVPEEDDGGTGGSDEADDETDDATGEGAGDDGASDSEDSGAHERGPDPDRHGRRAAVDSRGCSAPVGGAGWWLALVLLGLQRRREEAAGGEEADPRSSEEDGSAAVVKASL